MSVRLSLITLTLLLGCRDDAKPASNGAGSASPRSSGGARTRPQLDTKRPAAEIEAHEAAHAGPARDFDAEPEDPVWAKATAAEIKTWVPGVDVRCKTRKCQAVIVAKTPEEAIAKTGQLEAMTQRDSQEPFAQWMPMQPANVSDGSIEVIVYAFFPR